MENSSKIFVYRDGLRFEVTPNGLFYAPEELPGAKKHPCPDCKFCQWCVDSRCSLCRRGNNNLPQNGKEDEEFKMV
jgi:hypothetical protein